MITQRCCKARWADPERADQGCQAARLGIFSRQPLCSRKPSMSFQKLDLLGHRLEALEHALAILGAD
ncbi:MAG: hypothetical protein E5X98_17225, partial [Mesorhizobium sp.]